MNYVVLIAMLLMGQLAYAAAPVFGTASETRFARDLHIIAVRRALVSERGP